MLNRFGKVLIHIVMLAVVSAIAAFWVIKILTPQPTAAPPPLAATPPREPNPTLTARLFGLIQAPQTAAVSNITVSGVFAAGKSGSAVLVVDGKPARAYVIGQDVSPGLRLADVQPEVVVLEGSGGARQELRVPARAAVASLGGGAAPPPAFNLDGNVLSAPSSTSAPASNRGMTAPSPAFTPPPPAPAPQIPGVGMTPAQPAQDQNAQGAHTGDGPRTQ